MSKPKCLRLLLLSLTLLSNLLVACSDDIVTTGSTPATIATTPAPSPTAVSGSSQVVQYDAGAVKLIDPRPNLAKTAPAGKKGGNLNMASSGDIKSLHPYLTSDTGSSDMQAFIWRAAFCYADPGTALCAPNFRVLDSVKVSNDKLTYSFTLKDGMKWSDGSPITSDDYVFTFKQAYNPANKWPYLDDYSASVASFTALDARTVICKLKAPELYGLDKCTLEPLPRKVWEGKDWSDPAKNPEIDNPTVVSGPWKLKEWKRDQYIQFVRNAASTIYPVPQLDTITTTIIKSSAEQVQKFRAGDLDYISVSPTDYDEARQATNGELVEFYRPRLLFDYIGFNFRKPYLQDVALRQAMAYATPQKDLIEKLQFGLAQPTYSVVPPSSPLFNPQTPRYDYNVDKARATLTAAGYRLENGKLFDRSGKELPRLKILFNTGNRVREGIASIVQQTYKEIGLDLEIVPLEFQAYLNAIKTEPFDYDLFVLGWIGGADFETFSLVWGTIPALNYGAWDTPTARKVLDLYKQARTEFDFNKRKEIMGQIQVLEATDLPYVFLYNGKSVRLISNRLNVSPLQPDGLTYNQYTDWNFK